MVNEKEFMYNLYETYFFNKAEESKRANKFSVDKLEEKYLQINELEINLKNILDCDTYHRALYSVTKIINCIEKKNLS